MLLVRAELNRTKGSHGGKMISYSRLGLVFSWYGESGGPDAGYLVIETSPFLGLVSISHL